MGALLFNNSSIGATQSIKLLGSNQKLLLKKEKKISIGCYQERNVNPRVLSKETSKSGTDNSIMLPSMSTKRLPKSIGIVEFFSGKNILVTGATGFVAKGKSTLSLLFFFILLVSVHSFFLFFFLKNKKIQLTLEMNTKIKRIQE